MGIVCAYCGGELEAGDGADAGDAAGMCPACVEHFRPFWEGMALGEYLERFDRPVLVTDGTSRVIACNGRGAALLGRDRTDFVGRTAGEAVACVHARSPGGCGAAVHCRECTLRRTIERTSESGAPVEGVPAYVDTAAGRVPLRISTRPVGRAVQVTVEEVGPPAPAPRR